MQFRPSLSNPWFVAVVFIAMTLAFTWPVAATLSTRNAGDLGDPLFICWVLMWTGGQTLRFLKGDWHALADYWNGNIFYPEKLTLAYSEHFTGQMLQILPVFAATGNIILCYNLLYLSTFVLSGLGMYLLVRELTGRPLAGVLAGVAFAFAPYRADQLPHLHVLSSQWMPLALYGFRRYFTTGHRRPLAGATAAMVMQVWSCGYYFFFFVPVAAAYCAYEMISRRLMTRRAFIDMAISGALTLLLVLPFLLPYARLRAEQNMGRRSLSELALYSADTHSFAAESIHIRFPTAKVTERFEGQTFAGFAVLAFALIGVVSGLRGSYRESAREIPRPAWWRRIGIGVAMLATIAIAAGLLLMAVHGPRTIPVFGFPIRFRDGTGALVKAVASAGILLAIWPRLRRTLTRPSGSLLTFSVVAVILTALFTLGPHLTANGRPFGYGPYLLLYKYVPGFDGLRVPARYFMVTLVFLSMIAGLGASWLIARWKRAGAALVVVGMAAMMIEGWIAPVEVGRPLWQGVHFDPKPFDFPSASTLNPVYARLRDEPGHVVVIEFPFGEPSYDMRAVYMAGFHRKALVNGFSGFFPRSFSDRIGDLGWNSPSANAAATWRALEKAGVTHAVVHEGVFYDEMGAAISNGLRLNGARELAASGKDRLFALK